MDRRNTKQSLHLPEEIIEDILLRVAVKSLLKSRCVSKSWRSLIDSKRFIETHHKKSIQNPSFPQQRVILQKDSFDWPEQHSLQWLLSEPPILTSRLDYPTNTTLIEFRITGCYNGLLCVYDTHRRTHLWNPSTRISKKLPEISDGLVWNFGFGGVESSGEYKVFVSVRSQGIKWVGKVYSSKTKSCKTIDLCVDLLLCRTRGLFAGGKLYWYKTVGKEELIFLDLKSEVFGRIELPSDQEFRFEVGEVGVLGGCLCVLYYHLGCHELGFRVWVMKESWEKLVTLPHLLQLLQPPPLVVGLQGEILVNFGSILLVYDCRDNVFRKVKDSDFFSHLVYVESLVSPEDL